MIEENPAEFSTKELHTIQTIEHRGKTAMNRTSSILLEGS